MTPQIEHDLFDGVSNATTTKNDSHQSRRVDGWDARNRLIEEVLGSEFATVIVYRKDRVFIQRGLANFVDTRVPGLEQARAIAIDYLRRESDVELVDSTVRWVLRDFLDEEAIDE